MRILAWYWRLQYPDQYIDQNLKAAPVLEHPPTAFASKLKNIGFDLEAERSKKNYLSGMIAGETLSRLLIAERIHSTDPGFIQAEISYLIRPTKD